jgi:hypothetical protein
VFFSDAAFFPPSPLPCRQEDVILVEASDEDEDEFDLEGDGFVDFDADDDVILSNDDEGGDFEDEEDGACVVGCGVGWMRRLGWMQTRPTDRPTCGSWSWYWVGCRDSAVAVACKTAG